MDMLLDWAKKHGVEASKEELVAFTESALANEEVPLSDEELDNVAGGKSYGNFLTYMASSCSMD